MGGCGGSEMKGQAATVGSGHRGPHHPTSGLLNASLVLLIVFLFSPFRNFLPHLPSRGFLEITDFS